MINSKKNFTTFKKNSKFFDTNLIKAMYILMAFSTFLVYSATRIVYSTYYLKKEIMWIVLGTIIFIIISNINYKILFKYSKIFYYLMLVSLIGVYVIGHSSKGAARWISIFGFKLQPSEFAKILILIAISEMICQKFPLGIKNFKDVIRLFLPIALPIFLILKQPDLGTALIILFMFLFIVFIYELELKKFFILIVFLICLAPLFFMFLKGYQVARLLVFLNPQKFSHGQGWNIIQSKIAVGSGGLIGKGIFHGMQTKLKFLPEAHTDFIFAVLSEELGFIGILVVLSLFFYIIISLIKYGNKVEDIFGKLLLFGTAILIFCHTFINIGMVIGLLPVTGVPLPFLSYGGSSFLLMFILLGICQSVIINNKQDF